MPGPNNRIHEIIVFTDTRTGREERLTMTEAFVRYLELGICTQTVCGVCGIYESTFYAWMARGTEHCESDDIPEREKPYVAFYEAITKARERGIAWHEANLRKGAESDPRLSLEYLARRRASQYARQDKLEHSGKVTHEVDEKIDGEIAELVAALSQSGQTQTPG